jgi:hypothetical protein
LEEEEQHCLTWYCRGQHCPSNGVASAVVGLEGGALARTCKRSARGGRGVLAAGFKEGQSLNFFHARDVRRQNHLTVVNKEPVAVAEPHGGGARLNNVRIKCARKRLRGLLKRNRRGGVAGALVHEGGGQDGPVEEVG